MVFGRLNPAISDMKNKRKSTDNVIEVNLMPYLHMIVQGALDLTCVLSVHIVITGVGK